MIACFDIGRVIVLSGLGTLALTALVLLAAFGLTVLRDA